MNDIRQKSIVTLDQLGSLVNRIPTVYYSTPLECLQENSIGKHVRHIIEFYECLLGGLHEREVNYDLRNRNMLIETDPDFTLSRIGAIQEKIPLLTDTALIMKADLGSGTESFQSSAFRELAFTLDHCIHHLALIRIGMQQHFPEIPMEEELGVAFSTLRHLQQNPA